MKASQNNGGFSLVELLTVVSIIATISFIAVPSFQNFVRKARQAGAKSEIASLYKVQKIFYNEYGEYHNNLPYIGFIPDGIPLDANNCPSKITTEWSTRHYTTGALTNAISSVPIPEFPDMQCGSAGPNTIIRFDNTESTAIGGIIGVKSGGIYAPNAQDFDATAVLWIDESNGIFEGFIMDENKRIYHSIEVK